MKDSNELKEIVKERYSKIVEQAGSASCCAGANEKPQCGCSSQKVEVSMLENEYDSIEGHVDEADLALGCGVPTKYAGIAPGNTVIDLGSGAGNDVFVTRQIVGPSGKVIGVDMTPTMIDKANSIKQKLGFENVEFYLGEIEALPLEENISDVVISNCVLNLVPDKEKAFSEIYRVLKPGGHFCISDIVLQGILPEKLQQSAELYAGCVAGAMQMEDYLGLINKTGFRNVEIKVKKKIMVPEDVLKVFLSAAEIEKFLNDQIGLYSITVVGYK